MCPKHLILGGRTKRLSRLKKINYEHNSHNHIDHVVMEIEMRVTKIYLTLNFSSQVYMGGLKPQQVFKYFHPVRIPKCYFEMKETL